MTGWLLVTLALAGGRTVTASTLSSSVGEIYALGDIKGESLQGWQASCKATDRSTLACSLYDNRGKVQSGWSISSVRGDVVTFEDPSFGRTGGKVTLTLAGAGSVFPKTSGARVPLK